MMIQNAHPFTTRWAPALGLSDTLQADIVHMVSCESMGINDGKIGSESVSRLKKGVLAGFVCESWQVG